MGEGKLRTRKCDEDEGGEEEMMTDGGGRGKAEAATRGEHGAGPPF